MSKFDGILICTDLDGTFSGGEDSITKNIEAVIYFTKNGGKFTFATGRMSGHLDELGLFDIINAPACLCNGGIIYDYQKKSVISEIHVDFVVSDFLDAVKMYPNKNISFHIYQNSREDQPVRVAFENTDMLSDELLNTKPIKIVSVFTSAEEADCFKKFAIEHPLLKNCYIAKSWPIGVEVNSLSATKGAAINLIKDYLGNIHTAIGIGDYENDIPLLCDADIGVAVENALDSVKENADMIVKCASDAAIKDLIEYLDTKYPCAHK